MSSYEKDSPFKHVEYLKINNCTHVKGWLRWFSSLKILDV